RDGLARATRFTLEFNPSVRMDIGVKRAEARQALEEQRQALLAHLYVHHRYRRTRRGRLRVSQVVLRIGAAECGARAAGCHAEACAALLGVIVAVENKPEVVE